MKLALNVLLVLTMVAYPLVVYAGLSAHVAPRALAVLLLAVILARLLLLRGATRENLRRLLPVALAAGLIGGLVLITNSEGLLLLHPVVVSLVMLGVFATTLRSPPSMAERFARLQHPDLPPHAVAYCRRVTQLWCVFFATNAAIALWTVLQTSVGEPRQVWTLYNGLISYILMGLLGGIEYLVRRRRQRAFDGVATHVQEGT